jgi:hypothetical protein
LSGAVERITVIYGPDFYTNYVTTNIWKDYFAQWVKCDAAKRMLSESLSDGKWVYPKNSYAPDTLEVVNKSNLLAKLSLPTNWFEVTPRFNLAMETNGWMFIPDIQSNIVWRGFTSDFYHSFMIRTNGQSALWYAVTNNYELTNELYNIAVAAGPSNYTENAGGQSWVTYDYPNLEIMMYKVKQDYQFNSQIYAYSNAWRKGYELELYNLASRESGESTERYPLIFDDQDDAVFTNWTAVTNFTMDAYELTSPILQYGPTEITNPPPRWFEGFDTDVFEYGWKGYQLENNDARFFALLRYNADGLTNGFKWFR